ncbi:MAG: hypothetical protein LH632_19130, partial [Rhodoferax sp.]|nr:hypothetical protein [Rhodoferax sp.]
ISRLETRNDGALSGGHELSFVVNGTAGAKTSVSLDGGKTSIPLAEEKAGHYIGSYTVKSRDQLNNSTQFSAALALGAESVGLPMPSQRRSERRVASRLFRYYRKPFGSRLDLRVFDRKTA